MLLMEDGHLGVVGGHVHPTTVLHELLPMKVEQRKDTEIAMTPLLIMVENGALGQVGLLNHVK